MTDRQKFKLSKKVHRKGKITFDELRNYCLSRNDREVQREADNLCKERFLRITSGVENDGGYMCLRYNAEFALDENGLNYFDEKSKDNRRFRIPLILSVIAIAISLLALVHSIFT